MNALEKFLKNQMEIYSFLKNPKTVVKHIPSNIYIEPTNACNLKCRFCARGGDNYYRKPGVMQLEEFKKLIDKLVENDWYSPLSFSGHGESLLHKDLIPMIKYAKEKGFNVSLISNSTFLTEEKIKGLLESGLDRFQTMFDSMDKESYESLRVGSNFEKTKANLIKLIEMNEEAGHPLFVSLGLVHTSINKDKEETKKFWNSLPIDNFYHSPLFSLQADSGLYSEAIKIMETGKKGICITPFITITVLYNGDVTLCALDFNAKWVTGNIFKDSMEEIWNGEKAQRLRKAMLDDDTGFFKETEHNCHKCNTPYIEEYTKEGHIEPLPIRTARKVRSYLLKESVERRKNDNSSCCSSSR